MKPVLIVYLTLLFAGATACSESTKSNGGDTGDSLGNADTSSETTVLDSVRDADSAAESGVSTSGAAGTAADSDTTAYTAGNTPLYSQSDSVRPGISR